MKHQTTTLKILNKIDRKNMAPIVLENKAEILNPEW